MPTTCRCRTSIGAAGSDRSAARTRWCIRAKDLKTLSPAAVRALIFGKQKLRTDEDVEVIGANQAVKDALNASEFGESISFTD